MNQHAPGVPSPGALIEQVVTQGDLTNLSNEQRARLYIDVCESVGLNPMTQPLEFLRLNNKLVLYAKKGATDQLRKIHEVSVVNLDTEIAGDLYIATVKVTDRTGRTDIDMGAVTIKGLAGENLVNAMLKAVTKAKRRATLSMFGLGMLDETEVESIPNARVMPISPAELAQASEDPTPPDRPTGSQPKALRPPLAENNHEEFATAVEAAVDAPEVVEATAQVGAETPVVRAKPAGNEEVVNALHKAGYVRGFYDPDVTDSLHANLHNLTVNTYPALTSMTELLPEQGKYLLRKVEQDSEETLRFWCTDWLTQIAEATIGTIGEIRDAFARHGLVRRTNAILVDACEQRFVELWGEAIREASPQDLVAIAKDFERMKITRTTHPALARAYQKRQEALKQQPRHATAA